MSKVPTHPFESWPPERRRRLGWVSAAAALGLGSLLLALGRPLSAPGAPHGLLSFELAADPASLTRVLTAWGEPGRSRAVLMTWLDFPFLAAYGTVLACASLQVRGAARLPGLARGAAWAASAAAFLDIFENCFGLALLAGSPAAPLAALMACCAAVKFSLLPVPLAWSAAGLFLRQPREL